MENITVFLGIILCLLFVTVIDSATVTVPANSEVLPGTETTLECTGSEKELSYYIKNRFLWTFIPENGNARMNLTDSFYLSKEAEAQNAKNENHQYTVEHVELPESVVLQLRISGITHKDDGVYKCSLLDFGTKVIAEAEMRLTVLNPVESVNLQIHDSSHNTLKESMASIQPSDAPYKLVPGKYMVVCKSEGSNPAPTMELIYNEQKQKVTASPSVDKSGNRIKVTGTVSMHQMEFKASGGVQALVCRSDVPNHGFIPKEAGIALLVEVDKPEIMCSEPAFREGDRYQDVICNITSPHGSGGLLCDKVSWSFGGENEVKVIGEQYKDVDGHYDIMESVCMKTDKGLETKLQIFELKMAHFGTMFFVGYGAGENAHRVPIQIEMTGRADGSRIMPVSLFACIAMVFLTRLAATQL